MHRGSGTTVIDFIYNASEILFPALAIFMVVMTIFCVYVDIEKRTIIGKIAFSQGRNRVIWSKLGACTLYAFSFLAFFFIVFAILGSLIVGGSLPPLALVIFAGNVIPISPVFIILLQFIGLLIKLTFLIAFTAFLSILIKNKYILLALSLTVLTILLNLTVFLSPFTLFSVIFWPILVASTTGLLFATAQMFKRREFL